MSKDNSGITSYNNTNRIHLAYNPWENKTTFLQNTGETESLLNDLIYYKINESELLPFKSEDSENSQENNQNLNDIKNRGAISKIGKNRKLI